jgi:hypothetical protein
VTKGLARSVQTRLVHHAHALGVDPNLVLARYAAERLLYRLSCSGYANRFVLKGALMLLVWLGETIRPTRDVDLLGSGALETAIAEKLHAMVELGSKNSRMRDFFDARERFDGAELARAIASTFSRRRTPVPAALPLALTVEFAAIEGKPAQWNAFARRLPAASAPASRFCAARHRHVCRSSANRRRPPGAVQPHLAAWRAVALTAPPAESPVSTRESRLRKQVGEMVEQKGFEPSTPTLRTWCSPS